MAEKVSSITKAPAVSDVHILWITAGLSCDGDSVSVTAAEQPSIEDVLLGAIPGLPKVHLHKSRSGLRERRTSSAKFFYEAEKGLGWIPLYWWSKAPSLTRRSRQRATGRRWGTNPDTG